MPPKRFYNDDDSDSSDSSSEDTTTETSSSEEESSSDDEQVMGRMGAAGGRAIANNPHDMEFDAGEDDEGQGRVSTPPNQQQQNRAPAPAPASANHQMLQNNPNDESYMVDDDRGVHTPPGGQGAAEQQQQTGQAGAEKPANLKTGLLQNDSHDEFEDVEDDMDDEETPLKSNASPQQYDDHNASTGGANGFNTSQGFNPNASNVIQNQHHDEEVSVSDTQSQITASPSSTAQSSPQSVKKMPQQQKSVMQPDDSSEDETSSSSEEDDLDDQPRMGQATEQARSSANIEYNPDDYAHLNNKVSREVRELFMHIAGYQAVTQELPSKLIPFIPDYLPCVGDIDTFCKIPRPDEQADNFGLVVVDEPCANQSNPAIVKMTIEAMTQHRTKAVYVESVEDAQNRPQLIDKWISDIKELHAKKPLPTVNYTKPMPDIETLLQVWPQEFEDLLNSDVQFPPPTVDLDIEQYVRTMCAILDIPCYSNLIESLHVMFTLYLEFRANQHFQHA